MPGPFMMQTVPRAVFFDVDGVLLDSLPQHLHYSELKAREYGLDVRVPDVETFREAVSRGMRVSPMLYFFLALGFPRPMAERGVVDYEHDFVLRCPPMLFPGIDAMLSRLLAADQLLGLVTSNTRANVAPTLGPLMMKFDRRLLFFHDYGGDGRDKRECLLEGARRLGLPSASCVYVGDQPADRAAAAAAGVRFLGVRFGWGFANAEPGVFTVDSVAAIATALLAPVRP